MQYPKPRAPKIKSQCIPIHPSSNHLAGRRVTPSCSAPVILMGAVLHSDLHAQHAQQPRECMQHGNTFESRPCQGLPSVQLLRNLQSPGNLSQIRLFDAAIRPAKQHG